MSSTKSTSTPSPSSSLQNSSPPSNMTLTPHTLRLLRLITSSTTTTCSTNTTTTSRSTSSSTSPLSEHEHTSRAIHLLKQIASQSPPLLLWDILARLYSALTHDENHINNDNDDNYNSKSNTGRTKKGKGNKNTKKTKSKKRKKNIGLVKEEMKTIQRENIALAMQHVASFIPIPDQVHFFQDAGGGGGGNQKEEEEEENICQSGNYLWLTVRHFLPNDQNNNNNNDDNNDNNQEDWSTLQHMLQHGRELLACNIAHYDLDENEYEVEQKLLSSLDDTVTSSSSSSSTFHTQTTQYIQERVRLQRQILARRLGMGGILSSSIVSTSKSEKGGGSLDLGITVDDLLDSGCATGTIGMNDTTPTTPNNTTSTGSKGKRGQRGRKRTIESKIEESNKYGSNKKRKVTGVATKKKSSKQQSNKKGKRRQEENKVNGGDEGEEEEEEDGTPKIRNILLMSLQHSIHNHAPTNSTTTTRGTSPYTSSSSLLTSHKNPQTLLATDLIYHTFHPSWSVRHGALLGLNALLKSWRGQVRGGTTTATIGSRNCRNTTSSTNVDAALFGQWPQDILTRCLCILALDRFGDYSGPSILTMQSGNNSDNSGATVAPVREAAAQVISSLLTLLPTSHEIHASSCRFLAKLFEYEDEWEVRHGAMLAFKYIISITLCCLSSSISNSKRWTFSDGESKQEKSSSSSTAFFGNGSSTLGWLATISSLAVKGLADTNEDVRGVSAQVLQQLLKQTDPKNVSFSRDDSKGNTSIDSQDLIKMRKHILMTSSKPLWNAMESMDRVSSCAIDLVQLFATEIALGCDIFLKSISSLSSPPATTTASTDIRESIVIGTDILETLIDKIMDILTFPSPSVRLSCLHTIAYIAQPIIENIEKNMQSCSSSSGSTKSCASSASATFQRYCNLLINVFNAFFDDTSTLIDGGDDANDGNDNVQDDGSGEKSVLQYQKDISLVARNKAWDALVQSLSYLSPQVESNNLSFMICDTIIVLMLRLVDIPVSMRSLVYDENKVMIADKRVLPLNRLGAAKKLLHGKISNYYDCLLAASNSLAKLCSLCIKFDREKLLILMGVMINTLLESPWPEFCEAGCVFARSLSMVFTQQSHEVMNSVWADMLYECQKILLQMLVHSPKCVMIVENHPNAESFINNEQVANLCDKILVSTLDNACDMDKNNAIPPSSIQHSIKDYCTQITNVLSRILQQQELNVPDTYSQIATTTPTSMRLASSAAGSIVAMGKVAMPEKMTPFIRALITSVKNEESYSRSESTCRYLVQVAHLASDLNKKVYEKVINNIVDIASINVDDKDTPLVSTQQIVSSYNTAKRFLQNLISDMSQEETLESIDPIWCRIGLLEAFSFTTSSESELNQGLQLLKCIMRSLRKDSKMYLHTITKLLPSVSLAACLSPSSNTRNIAMQVIVTACKIDASQSVPLVLPILFDHLRKLDKDSERFCACELFNAMISDLGVSLCPFVRNLLPVAMSMMTDPVKDCADLSSDSFAHLVRLAPLVSCNKNEKSVAGVKSDASNAVIDHLIHGKPLPPCELPHDLGKRLHSSGITLRQYQIEGISWINFLRSVNLNGALCDDMGLGKTLQCLVAVAVAHHSYKNDSKNGGSIRRQSLVICPSSIVGHWINETLKLSPMFKSLQYAGPPKKRKQLQKNFEDYDIIITSYPILRLDSSVLKTRIWTYIVLDEGHLLKNPKTATAKAARSLRSQHKLILSGTPIQNKVNELWAIFDFLMPNFLGSETEFTSRFAKDIIKGHLPGAPASNIRVGMQKLRTLHQQVLPFILRREKDQVLDDLPPKTITDIPCTMTEAQSKVYSAIYKTNDAQRAMKMLEQYLKRQDDRDDTTEGKDGIEDGNLKSLMYLRMVCTHPEVINRVSRSGITTKEGIIPDNANEIEIDPFVGSIYHRFDCSGKLSALSDLLLSAGIYTNELTAADNDQSLVYVKNQSMNINSDNILSNDNTFDGDLYQDEDSDEQRQRSVRKCLIFAQFTYSLDVLQDFLLEPHMPALRYLRLDGRVKPQDRHEIIDRFNNDDSITCLLLTTKVGGLGLNLQVADMVIFLENDWNPHADLQAMDRVHRLGQKKNVNVYRIITKDTIEQKIMELQRVKLAMSNAIVNSDNSTMFSMGTDRLLDIFS